MKFIENVQFWRSAIEAFDADLRKRMLIIEYHEFTGFNFDSSFFVRRALGFPDRRRFPWWRDYQAAWISRNRDRRNEQKRLRYRQRCKLGLKTQYYSSPEARKRADVKYKELHREEITIRQNARIVLKKGVFVEMRDKRQGGDVLSEHSTPHGRAPGPKCEAAGVRAAGAIPLG